MDQSVEQILQEIDELERKQKAVIEKQKKRSRETRRTTLALIGASIILPIICAIGLSIIPEMTRQDNNEFSSKGYLESTVDYLEDIYDDVKYYWHSVIEDNEQSGSAQQVKPASVQQVNNDPYAVGENILFGRYEQDGNDSNGLEAIEWQILDKKGDQILLLSLYVLENKYYDERLMGLNHNVDWENSTLRKWIKNTFYYSAFNSSERESIVLTTNDGSSDYVFLLSQEEVKKYLDAHSRKCTMTVAAEKTPGGGHYRDCVEWWLRITGGSTKYAPTVAATGIGGTIISSEDIYSSRYGVRPAIWIKIC